MAINAIPKKPVPGSYGGNILAPHCPACGKYPGAAGVVVCQYCGEKVYAPEYVIKSSGLHGALACLFGLDPRRVTPR